MTVEIRTIDEDEFEAAARSLGAAFSGAFTEEDRRRERPVTEFDRCHAAVEDGQIIGCALAATFRITVPGERDVPAAGITGVGVQPTHRRLGVNTAMMRAQLDDVHERGEPLAVLYASEGSIYGRFGYGVAAFLGEINLDVERSGFVRGYRPSGRVRLLERDDALPLMRPVHDAEQACRPGMIAMDDRWWEWLFFTSEKEKEEPVFYAVRDTEGEVDAYCTYTVKHEWPDSIAQLKLTVRQLLASTPQAWADMWRFVFDIDLVHSVNAWNRPVDEPLLHLMREPRRLRFSLKDGLYIRLIDVPAALSSRGYAREGSVVIEVDDPFCVWNTGRYLLETNPAGGTCARTTASAEIACTATDLGSTYLGGVSFRQLHRAGRVEEMASGALARIDALFASDPAPWCPFFF
jgi:predicted acetyltransferase